MYHPKMQRIICNCTKSNCLKKYCECYKHNYNCNSLCRCRDCKNKICVNANNNPNNLINYENNNNLTNPNFSQLNDYNTSNYPETFGKINNFNNPINFQIEAFGIAIKKSKLIEKKRKINIKSTNTNNEIINDPEAVEPNSFNGTPKFSNKKRSRSRNDISNRRTSPMTNSSNQRRKRGLSNINKNIQQKKLQLN